jgi:hypothetical protein
MTHPVFRGMDNDCYLWKSSYEKPSSNPFDGYAYVNGTLNGNAGEFEYSYFRITTVGTGPVNMKLESNGSWRRCGANWRLSRSAKLNADPNTYNATNYLTLNHAGNTTNNFSILFFRFQQQAKSDPILKNNTESILVCLPFPTQNT